MHLPHRLRPTRWPAVLTVQGAMPRDADFKQRLCADIDGFSLHAAVRCGADDRQALEQLITRPALANEGVSERSAGGVPGGKRAFKKPILQAKRNRQREHPLAHRHMGDNDNSVNARHALQGKGRSSAGDRIVRSTAFGRKSV